jgi:hypothetical protein
VQSSVLLCARAIHFITTPKAKPFKSCRLKRIVLEFTDDIFSTDGDILYCGAWERKVAAEKQSRHNIHVQPATST